MLITLTFGLHVAIQNALVANWEIGAHLIVASRSRSSISSRHTYVSADLTIFKQLPDGSLLPIDPSRVTVPALALDLYGDFGIALSRERMESAALYQSKLDLVARRADLPLETRNLARALALSARALILSSTGSYSGALDSLVELSDSGYENPETTLLYPYLALLSGVRSDSLYDVATRSYQEIPPSQRLGTEPPSQDHYRVAVYRMSVSVVHEYEGKAGSLVAKVLARMLQERPGDRYAIFHSALLAKTRGQHDLAIALLDRYIALSPPSDLQLAQALRRETIGQRARQSPNQ